MCVCVGVFICVCVFIYVWVCGLCVCVCVCVCACRVCVGLFGCHDCGDGLKPIDFISWHRRAKTYLTQYVSFLPLSLVQMKYEFIQGQVWVYKII